MQDAIVENMDDQKLRGWIAGHYGRNADEDGRRQIMEELAGHDRTVLLSMFKEDPTVRKTVIDRMDVDNLRQWIKWYMMTREGSKASVDAPEPDNEVVEAQPHKQTNIEMAKQYERIANLLPEQKELIRDMEKTFDFPEKWLTAQGVDIDMKPILDDWTRDKTLNISMIGNIFRRLGRGFAELNDTEPLDENHLFSHIDGSAPDYTDETRELWLEAVTTLLNKLLPDAKIELLVPETRRHLRSQSSACHGW